MSVGNLPADGVRVYACLRYHPFFISQSQDDLMFLTLIVVIRTTIGYSLAKELEEVRQLH